MAALGASNEGAKPLVDLSNFGGFARPAGGPSEPPVPTSRTPAAVEDNYTGVVILQGSGKAPEGNAPAGPQSAEGGRSAGKAAPDAVADWHESQRGATGRPWLMLTLVILVGVGTAAAVGLSGPSLDTDTPSGTEMDRVSAPVSPTK
jgi:hypothetical protein